jgi:hypothetical protein
MCVRPRHTCLHARPIVDSSALGRSGVSCIRVREYTHTCIHKHKCIHMHAHTHTTRSVCPSAKACPARKPPPPLQGIGDAVVHCRKPPHSPHSLSLSRTFPRIQLYSSSIQGVQKFSLTGCQGGGAGGGLIKTDLAELYSTTNRVDFAGQHTQRGIAFAWRQSRTRKRSRCQWSGGGLGTDTALGFWDTGNRLILSHAARERRL